MVDIVSGRIAYDGEQGQIQAFLARPETDEPRPAIVVVHEIYGLDDHIQDVARRFASQGYVALAPHLFTRPGLAEVLTPATIGAVMQFRTTLAPDRASDPAYLQQRLSELPPDRREVVARAFPLLFGGIKEPATQDLVKAVQFLGAQRYVEPNWIASVGFCFGGGLSLNLACSAPLSACVVLYGENPGPIERVQAISCPVLGLYGAEDLRINSRLHELVKAMVDYKKDFEMRIYPGAGHAFFNDTRQAVYREEAARDAWDRILRFYRRC